MSEAVITCCSCGVHILVPQNTLAELKRTGNTFYCINGHAQHFNRGQSEADRLREQLKTCKEVCQGWIEEAGTLRARAEALEASLRGTKGAYAKLKKRLQAQEPDSD